MNERQFRLYFFCQSSFNIRNRIAGNFAFSKPPQPAKHRKIQRKIIQTLYFLFLYYPVFIISFKRNVIQNGRLISSSMIIDFHPNLKQTEQKHNCLIFSPIQLFSPQQSNCNLNLIFIIIPKD
jgi:hypothetical protein